VFIKVYINITDTMADTSDGTVLEEGRSKSKGSETFLDYVPPPRPPVPPPARYKLSLCIWFTVYFVAMFATESGITPSFIVGGLNPPEAVFATYLIIVFVMVFFGVEVVIGLSRIKIRGKWYGTLPWLMQPRCQWVKESNNVFVEILAVIVGIAEDGFEIFNAPKLPPPPRKIHVFDLIDKENAAVLRAQHKVNPDKLKEYQLWSDTMVEYMEAQPGFDHAEKEGEVDGGVHTWKLRFENVHALNNCMASPTWVRMVGELGPMLDAPKVTQIMMEHPPINALADMLTRQGDASPLLPPKKWKVWWTTAISLFFSNFLIVGNTAAGYFLKWGWTANWNRQLLLLVNIGCVVFVLNYIMTPAILLFVGHWMIRVPHESDNRYPWKLLNEGVPPPVQVILCIIYFVATGLVWIYK